MTVPELSVAVAHLHQEAAAYAEDAADPNQAWEAGWNASQAALFDAVAALLEAIEDTLDPLIPENAAVLGRAGAVAAVVVPGEST